VGKAAAAAPRQIDQAHTRLIRRQHAAERGRDLTLEEITDELCRSVIFALAELEGTPFQRLLELDAVERMHAPAVARVWPLRIVFRGDADDDAGICVAFGARILAHAIGDNVPQLRSGGDNRAARAHAETVDRAAAAGVVHEPVVGRTEHAMA